MYVFLGEVSFKSFAHFLIGKVEAGEGGGVGWGGVEGWEENADNCKLTTIIFF